jgi:hypothetical protein
LPGLVRRRRRRDSTCSVMHAEKIKHRKQFLKQACIDLKNKINSKKSLVLSATSTTNHHRHVHAPHTESTPDCIYQYELFLFE